MSNIEFSNVFTKNYTEYAKYTIRDRAIPSLEDGCKTIHRRIIWSMYSNKNTWDRKRIKANTAVGLAMCLSPHGNSSIYGAMVRFANDSVNINLIDGKGAFSSKTSRDVNAGADRYVEVRLSPFAKEYLKDSDKNLAGMKHNYDNTKLEPILLPTTFPTILANPNLGIATGIACNICAFEISELIDTTINILNKKDTKYMIPTFSTGGQLIFNEEQLNLIKNKGKGKLTIRSTYEYEDDKIIITSIPYTTTREVIIEKIIDMVKKGELKDILDINDNTGREGLKITIEVKKSCDKDKLMRILFKKTTLQDIFSCNFNVLDNGVPKVLGTDAIIKKWIIFRQSCLKNKIEQDIQTKNDKLNILLGLKQVLLDIDKTIDVIRTNSKAKEELIKLFNINNEQVEYILNMKLKNINKDYIIKQIKDIDNLQKDVDFLKDNINNEKYINSLIEEDLLRVKKEYSYKRQTEIIYEDNIEEINDLDLIEDFTTTLVFTEQQYFKKCRRYSEEQNVKEGDAVKTIIQDSNKSKVLFFSNQGNIYIKNIWELNENKPSVLGQYLPNLLPLETDETIMGMISTNNYKGNSLIIYPDSHVALIDLEKGYYTKQNATRLKNSLAKKMELPIYIGQIIDDVDIELTDNFGKIKIVNTKDINRKDSRNAQGVTTWNCKKKGWKIVSATLIKN